MAATQVFQALLAGGLAGRVDPVGMPRSSSSAADNLERYKRGEALQNVVKV